MTAFDLNNSHMTPSQVSDDEAQECVNLFKPIHFPTAAPRAEHVSFRNEK